MKDKKYIIDTEENRNFLKKNVGDLLIFGRQFPAPGGSSYYLGDDGTPWKDRDRETWITSRMAHVYSIGLMLGYGESAELADAAICGLMGELKDEKNGGWYAGLTADGRIVPGKQCYAHAFVILAATSALLAGRDGAGELLEKALKIYDEKFWNEEKGLSCDNWNTEFTVLDDYRGINANMHTVEAFLAVADALDDTCEKERNVLNDETGKKERNGLSDEMGKKEQNGLSDETGKKERNVLNDETGKKERNGLSDETGKKEQNGLSDETGKKEQNRMSDAASEKEQNRMSTFLSATGISDKYRKRAGRIIDHVIGWARDNQYRIPEHFTRDWQPDLEKNKERPDDPFKPYGATPGHGIEWARLIIQWATSTYGTDSKKAEIYIKEAASLFDRAVADAWNADGAPGIVYTTDWNGKPVVRDRMHWTLAEAINSSAVLFRVTGEQKYADWYAEFMEYLDTTVLDHSCGSWFHQLDEKNCLKNTVWPGKSDIYHALQAMLIPYSRVDVSIARKIADKSF